MRFISLFSGIEAASVAWGPLGWEAAAFAEIEPFPCAVLKYRFPDVPNLGDVTKIDWRSFIEESGPVDLVCGGSPCQSFSIAGGREGLDGESRLMYEYIRAVDEVRPRWLLWENVPGVFSIDGGRAFGILIDALEELGYGLAWRTLDAQFFGVAQRRRRVFVVGHIGDVGRAAAVLFDAESVRGNTLTGREKRAALAEDARGRLACGFKPGQGAKAGGVGFGVEQAPTLITEGVPAVSIQGDGSTSTNSHGGGVLRGSQLHHQLHRPPLRRFLAESTRRGQIGGPLTAIVWEHLRRAQTSGKVKARASSASKRAATSRPRSAHLRVRATSTRARTSSAWPIIPRTRPSTRTWSAL